MTPAAKKKQKFSFRGSIGIVASRFNEYVTQRLLTACLEELQRQDIPEKQIKIVWVPGSFEIPVVALRLARQKSIKAVICLGVIIRGETFHFELVAQGTALGIMQVALVTGKPVILGVLSTDTVTQAQARSQKKGDNKGRDAAMAALEMISICK